MSFKLKSPYKINPVSVHQVPFSPDNIGESNGLVAKANDNGTIIMNKNIPQDSKLYNNAMSHEGRHLKDMMDNKLALLYFYFYYKIQEHPCQPCLALLKYFFVNA